MDTIEFLEILCRMRGIENPCPRCQGTGVRVYSNTATWLGGIGGATLTSDVCDSCWGSGDMRRKGVDLRKLDSFVASWYPEGNASAAHKAWREFINKSDGEGVGNV